MAHIVVGATNIKVPLSLFLGGLAVALAAIAEPSVLVPVVMLALAALTFVATQVRAATAVSRKDLDAAVDARAAVFQQKIDLLQTALDLANSQLSETKVVLERTEKELIEARREIAGLRTENFELMKRLVGVERRGIPD